MRLRPAGGAATVGNELVEQFDHVPEDLRMLGRDVARLARIVAQVVKRIELRGRHDRLFGHHSLRLVRALLADQLPLAHPQAEARAAVVLLDQELASLRTGLAKQCVHDVEAVETLVLGNRLPGQRRKTRGQIDRAAVAPGSVSHRVLVMASRIDAALLELAPAIPRPPIRTRLHTVKAPRLPKGLFR